MPDKTKLNKKGLIWFLSLTFIPTITVAIAMKIAGITFSATADIRGQLLLSGTMFFPMLAAIITQKIILKKKIKDLGFVIGPRSLYLRVFITIVALYILVYSLTWILVGGPDLGLGIFMSQYGLELPIPAYQMIVLITFLMLFVTPIINLLPSLGEELGWRGFLLQELLPLGTKKALIYSGIIWGLWHLPFVLLIGFGYSEYNLLGAPLFLVLITSLGVWFGYLRLVSSSVWLPSFAHAVFNAHAYGIWIMLWPNINPLFGGKVGIIALCIYIALALIILNKTEEKNNLLNRNIN